MNTSKYNSYIIVGILLLLGTMASSAYANHAWGKYHWNLSTATTLANPLDLGNNLSTSEWQQSLTGASSDWSQSVLKTEVAVGGSDADCKPTAGRVEVCNGGYGDNGWLGIASIWASRKDSHITQGTVKLNDTYFSEPKYNTTAWRNLVMCQEVGHTFGLDHQDTDFSNTNLETCMDYTNDPDGSLFEQLNNEHPNTHDYDMLASIYAHLNGTTSSGPGRKSNRITVNNTNVNLDNPSTWGEAIQQDAQGRNAVFVRNIDTDTVIITHVLWTPDTKASRTNK